MTTETMPEPTEEVLEDLRKVLAEALETLATTCATSAAHLEDTGDADAAHGELSVALLAAWLGGNVRAWTHTTRLREGLLKFDGAAAGVALAALFAEEDVPVKVTVQIPDDCSGEDTACHACRTEHPGGAGGAFCPAAGDVRPVSPDELDEAEEWRP